MAKSGRSSRLAAEGELRSAPTRQALVEAAIETLQTDGFSGASARAIAKRAECNQALVFYHFNSVVDLLLAALDSVSNSRLKHYNAAVEGVGSLKALVEVAATIFREDLENGYITVLAEMIAGASSTPGLGAEVAARISPWKQFAEQIINSTLSGTALGELIPSGDLAHGAVALYLGLELLSHLEENREASQSLFDHAKRLTVIAEAFGVGEMLGEAPRAPREEHRK